MTTMKESLLAIANVEGTISVSNAVCYMPDGGQIDLRPLRRIHQGSHPDRFDPDGCTVCAESEAIVYFRGLGMATAEEVRDLRDKMMSDYQRQGSPIPDNLDTDLPPIMPKDLRVQVSVYAVTRHYGGNEEGGWWWNLQKFTGISERVLPMDIDKAKERLLQLFADDQPGHNIYSMANEHRQFEVMVEHTCGWNDNSMQPKPHYE